MSLSRDCSIILITILMSDLIDQMKLIILRDIIADTFIVIVSC